MLLRHTHTCIRLCVITSTSEVNPTNSQWPHWVCDLIRTPMLPKQHFTCLKWGGVRGFWVGGVGGVEGNAYLPLTQEAAEFHSRSELKRGEGLSHVTKTSSCPSHSLQTLFNYVYDVTMATCDLTVSSYIYSWYKIWQIWSFIWLFYLQLQNYNSCP